MRYEISWYQFTMLIVASKLSLLATYGVIVVGRLPPVRDTWMAAIIASAIATVATLLVYVLSVRFPGKTVFQYSRDILGRFLGTAANLYLIALFLFWAAVTIRQFAFYMDTAVYLRTPDVVFGVGILLLALVAVREGFEFIGRIAEIAGVLVVAGLLFFFALALPIADLGRMRPVLGEGFAPVWDQALTPIGVFGEAVWIALLAIPYLNRAQEAPKAILTATAISTFMVAAGAALLITLLGEEFIALLALPPLTATRVLSIGETLERVEWLIVLMWMGAMGVKLSLLVFGASLGVYQTWPRFAYGKVVVAVTAAAFAVSRFVHTTLTEVLDFFAPEVYLTYALPLQLAPLALLAVAVLRGADQAVDRNGPAG